ncbi:AAA family ATPase [Candidatus Poriferisodalis sp.]|uniref:AAA family ATPase n=1 Tax=Candidatus Poriferisodalis sp. TaxID=3101277 RepID=UPI003B517B82
MTDATRDQDRQAVLDAERAVNEQYLAEIERLLAKQPHLVKQIDVVQSQQWTTAALPRPGIDCGAIAALIGRVALSDGHPYSDEMGQTFYIAGSRVKENAFETVNWAAPIARLYFDGRSSEHEIASSVDGRRTFVPRLTDLADYFDEIENDVADPFRHRARALEVPAAPTRRRPNVQRPQQQSPEPERVRLDEPPRLEPAEPSPEPAEVASGVDARQGGLRAAEAVVQVMQMPKQGRMGAILPTMQPDQYRLVAAAADRGLIVQGQPGTGKTAIAVHRAVYLTSVERDSERVARIAIIGPSDHYVEHVAPMIFELKEPGADIKVLSLPALLSRIAGLRAIPKPGRIGRIESSWPLGRTIDGFAKSIDVPHLSGRMDLRVRRVVEAMQRADASQIPDTDIRAWLRELPTWNEISGQARFLPMLATVALAVGSTEISEHAGHLIIDEAQDVRPLEWRVLTSSLLESGGSLSLFGDMNQRRSDWTAPTWQKLAVDLEMTDDAGYCDMHVLRTGYRSTRQILRFANQLLPRSERDEQALRDGPQPTVTRTSASELTAETINAAIDLTKRHTGMVAVIATQPRPVSTELRQRNWERGRWQHSWTRDGATVVVLHPDEARGLEFDAAVVVEPGDFPENVGRQGVLYTSLTRANKELIVVHTRRLPRVLRPPR